jgi:hypothetical protein
MREILRFDASEFWREVLDYVIEFGMGAAAFEKLEKMLTQSVVGIVGFGHGSSLRRMIWVRWREWGAGCD